MWAQVEDATDKPSLRLHGLLQSSNNVFRLRKLQLSWWTLLYSSPQLSFFRNEKEQTREKTKMKRMCSLKHVKVPFTIANWDILRVSSLIPVLLTFLSIHQSDLKAVPARLLRVEDHSDFRVGCQEGRFHLLGITPVHSSAFTIEKIPWVRHTTEVITTTFGVFVEKVCVSILTTDILFFSGTLGHLCGIEITSSFLRWNSDLRDKLGEATQSML